MPNIDLTDFDIDTLDAFEKMIFNDMLRHSTKEEALQIIINNAEGDFSQLSYNLADIAEKQSN